MNRVKVSHLTLGFLVLLVVSLMLVAVKPIYGQPTSVIPSSTCDPNNLTGKWRANDGGTYFIRQITTETGKKEIWWFGARSLQEGTPFSNMLSGYMENPSGREWKIWGDWYDVPLGNSRGEGKLGLSVDPLGQKITKTHSFGNGFSGSEWIKNCKTLPDIIKQPTKPSPFVK